MKAHCQASPPGRGSGEAPPPSATDGAEQSAQSSSWTARSLFPDPLSPWPPLSEQPARDTRTAAVVRTAAARGAAEVGMDPSCDGTRERALRERHSGRHGQPRRPCAPGYGSERDQGDLRRLHAHPHPRPLREPQLRGRRRSDFRDDLGGRRRSGRADGSRAPSARGPFPASCCAGFPWAGSGVRTRPRGPRRRDPGRRRGAVPRRPGVRRRRSSRRSAVVVPGQALRPSIRATQGERGCRATSAGGAYCTGSPSSSTRTWSASETASTGSCVTIRQTPGKPARWSRRACRTRALAVWSSAASGSSRRRRRGRAARARARATRCAWPPESWPGLRCARWPTPSRSSHSWASPRARALEAPWEVLPYAVLARAVMCGNSAPSCGTQAMPRRCGGSGATSCSPSRRESAVARSVSPRRARRRVVLPAPLGPTTATVRPPASSSATRACPSTSAASGHRGTSPDRSPASPASPAEGAFPGTASGPAGRAPGDGAVVLGSRRRRRRAAVRALRAQPAAPQGDHTAVATASSSRDTATAPSGSFCSSR